MSANKKPCPVCGKLKKNIETHIRLAHPEQIKASVTSSEVETPVSKGMEVKKISSIKWWRLLLGGVCALVGIVGIILYVNSLNMLMGIVAIIGLVPAVFLIYYAFNRKESGYVFSEKGKTYTGKENAIVIYADYNPETKRDVPDKIVFDYIEKPLPGARLHLLRNNGQHYYEYLNVTGEGRLGDVLLPVVLPDKKLCTPEAFCIPSNMHKVKEYMDYNPPTNIQKLATGAIILAMIIVGLLMVMTSPSPEANKTVMDILMLSLI